MVRLRPGHATVRLKPDATYDEEGCDRHLVRFIRLRALRALRRDILRLHHARRMVGAGNGIRTRDFDLGKVALYH